MATTEMTATITAESKAERGWRLIGAVGMILGVVSFIITTIVQWMLQPSSPSATVVDVVNQHPGSWLLVSVLWPLIVQFIVAAVYPPDPLQILFGGGPSYGQLELQQALSRLSPSTLFGESMLGLLHPATRALGPIFIEQLQGAVMGAPLPLGQSLLLVWPQATGLVAGTIVLFVIAYIAFQRREVRA